MSGADDPLLRVELQPSPWPADEETRTRLLEALTRHALEGMSVAPDQTVVGPTLTTVDDLVREVARYSPLGDEEDTAVRVETSSRQALCDLLRVGLPPEVDAWHPTPAITMWGLPVVVDERLAPGEVRLVRADGTVVAWVGRVS